MNSTQVLALFSPSYVKEAATYSKAEVYASWWDDSIGDKRRLIPVVIEKVKLSPLISMLSRIEVAGLLPGPAAARVIQLLRGPGEAEPRERLRDGSFLPPIFRAAYRPNPNFAGRFEALDRLQETLRTGTTAAVTAVAGMGGVGKTTLAAEYCHRFGGRYAGVWWVRSEQETTILIDLQSLGARLKLPGSGNVDGDAKSCLEYLANQADPWLIVYDNAPHPDAVHQWIPVGGVRSIITSRFADFGNIASVTRLDEWSERVTVDYLVARTGRRDEAGANILARTLGGLPLAAEQAAAFLVSRPNITFTKYADEISTLIKKPRPPGAVGSYPDTVYAAFARSLDALSRDKDNEISLSLLKCSSFPSPDGIEFKLFEDIADDLAPADFLTALRDPIASGDALSPLVSLSLVREETRSYGLALVFHRLLLEVMRDWMGNDARELWGGVAARLISRAFPFDADFPSEWLEAQRLMPHIHTLSEYVPSTPAIRRALARGLNQAGLFLAEQGDLEGSLVLAQRALEWTDVNSDKDKLVKAIRLSNIGRIYSDLGRFEEADREISSAFDIEETILDENDGSLAITISNLANVKTHLHKFGEAENLMLKASKTIKSVHGPKSFEYGIIVGNLMSFYQTWSEQPGESDKIKLSSKFAKLSMDILVENIGIRHPSTSNLYANQSILHSRLGKMSSAILLAEQALAIQLSLGLITHRHTQKLWAWLTHLLIQSGDTKRAKRLQEGDVGELTRAIAMVEQRQEEWVQARPGEREFGPPSAFSRRAS